MASTSPYSDRKFGPWPIGGNEIFLESEHSFAFVNLKPLVPGHVLVSPKRVLLRFADLSAAEIADLWTTAQRVGSKLEQHFGASSLTLAIQDGPAAGQTVPHVHIHVLPRKAGDFEKNDEVYDALDVNERETTKMRTQAQAEAGAGEKLDLDIERKPRTREEMAAEAAVFRTLFQ